jgi:hypothetical protein
VAASAGSRKSLVEGRDHERGSGLISTDGEDIELSGAAIADQAFIANAHQDVEIQLDAVGRLRKLLDEK